MPAASPHLGRPTARVLGTDHNCNKTCNKTYDRTENLKIIAQLLHNICSPH